MFYSARIQLTSWYLLIIMAISIAFSSFIYIESSHEFTRILRAQREHLNFRVVQVPPFTDVMIAKPPLFITQKDADDVIRQASIRVLESLLEINVVILLLSALAGYFLAGRTLRPIQKMVNDQNRFITDASHELNTPLTALRTTIEVNLRDKHFSLQKAKAVLESNLEEVTHLQILSDELIKLHQYQKSNSSIHFAQMSLQSIIDQAVEKVMPLAEKKQIHMHVHIPQLIVQGDARSLKELFIILLDNAIKYSPEKKNITIQATKKENKIYISVIDSGIGMSEEALQHIYNRFYRADTSRTKQQTPGYGLGLSIAKRIVTIHQGRLSATSILGKGTTFVVALPTV
jgi:two-component system sensor histidine kinase CiaH